MIDGIARGIAALVVALAFTRTGLPLIVPASLLGGLAIAYPTYDHRRTAGVFAGLAAGFFLLPMRVVLFGLF